MINAAKIALPDASDSDELEESDEDGIMSLTPESLSAMGALRKKEFAEHLDLLKLQITGILSQLSVVEQTATKALSIAEVLVIRVQKLENTDAQSSTAASISDRSQRKKHQAD